MYFLIYVLAIIIIYIVSFKGDFTDEKLQKIKPFFAVIIMLTIIVLVLRIAFGSR